MSLLYTYRSRTFDFLLQPHKNNKAHRTMCGIAGIIRFDGRPIEKILLKRQTDLIAHRGPDDAGFYLDGPVGLAHRRLSIIDLTPAGHQPMVSNDGSLWIVFNGEIYNHVELRDELRHHGHTFRSTTDTEVILAAWRHWGDDCVSRFEGMWAFALWEPATQRLFCSRDRLGIKPFYYTLTEAGMAFASEIKAVLASGLTAAKPDLEALRQQLVHRSRASSQTTCFQNIVQLPAAHNAVIQHGKMHISRYWNANDFIDRTPTGEPSRLDQDFLETLNAAVSSHLRSDVPVGACLSGGLDSGALVTLAANQMQQKLSTFSVTYPGTQFDESKWILALKNQEQNLSPFEYNPDGTDFVSVLEKATWHFEEPLWSHSVYSWWQVMKLVNANGIKVVLNGQGADELLGGYPRYYPSYLRELLLNRRVSDFRTNLDGFSLQQGGVSRLSLIRDLATPFLPGWSRQVLRLAGRGQAYDDSFLTGDLRAAGNPGSEKLARRAFSNLDEHLLSDLQTTRLPELLQAEDRFSMAFSIESRVPFLDRKFVEFCIGLPASRKIDNGNTKAILRSALRGKLPDITIDRRDKQGYPTPGEFWLRKYGAEYASDTFSSRRFRERGVFDLKVIDAAFKSWRTGTTSLPGLWTWLSTEEWFRKYVDQSLA